jgi:hypothetical protein
MAMCHHQVEAAKSLEWRVLQSEHKDTSRYKEEKRMFARFEGARQKVRRCVCNLCIESEIKARIVKRKQKRVKRKQRT